MYIVTELCRGGELLRVIRTFNAEARRADRRRLAPGGRASESSSDSDIDKLQARPHAVTSDEPSRLGLTMNPWGAGLPLTLARYYCAQLVCVLEYLHTVLHVVHRGVSLSCYLIHVLAANSTPLTLQT